MLKTILAGALLGLGFTTAAMAQVCPGYSYPLTDGTTAYGSQVMANFATIANCANTLLAPLTNPSFNGGVYTPAVVLPPGNEIMSDGGSGSYSINYRAGPPSAYVYFTMRSDGFLISNSNGVYGNGPIEGTTFLSTSDGRLKKNVVPLSNALDEIKALRPVRFQWRGVSERSFGLKLNLPQGESHLGFIAQEVASVVPEAVAAPQDADSPYRLKPMELIAVLVQAVKEQQVEIDQLKAQLASKQ